MTLCAAAKCRLQLYGRHTAALSEIKTTTYNESQMEVSASYTGNKGSS